MNGEKCDVCGKSISEYGTKYAKMELMQNSQSQGMPDVFPAKIVESCMDCVGKAIIGFGDNVPLLFQCFEKKNNES